MDRIIRNLFKTKFVRQKLADKWINWVTGAR